MIFSGVSIATPDPPPPDIYVSHLDFEVFGQPASGALAGSQVTIVVAVGSNGTGDYSGANASFYCDGSFLGLMRVPDMKALVNFTFVRFLWETAGRASGLHNISVTLDAPGDANESNNDATVDFLLFHRSVLDVTIDEPVQEASLAWVKPSDIFSFTGNVSVNNSSERYITVLLEAVAEFTHLASVTPQAMHFGPGNQSQNFTLTTWPGAADFSRYSWHVVMTAAVTGEGYAEQASAQAEVRFKPAAALILWTETPFPNIGSAKLTKIVFNVEGRGNVDATYNLSVDGLKKLEDSGWHIRLSRQELELGPYETAEITLTAEYTRDWPAPEAIFPRYDSTRISVRATAVDGSVTTASEIVLMRQGYNGQSLLLVCIGVAAVTISVVLLPIGWPGRNKVRSRRAVLAMYWVAVLALTIGGFILLLSQGMFYRLTTDAEKVESSGGGWGPGALVLPFVLPFILIGTYVLVHFFADERTSRRPWPYVVILSIEAVFLMGFVPYPMGFYHSSHWTESSADILIRPLLDNPGASFILLFVMIFSLGLSFWYLFRPDSWPLFEKKTAKEPGTRDNS